MILSKGRSHYIEGICIDLRLLLFLCLILLFFTIYILSCLFVSLLFSKFSSIVFFFFFCFFSYQMDTFSYIIYDYVHFLSRFYLGFKLPLPSFSFSFHFLFFSFFLFFCVSFSLLSLSVPWIMLLYLISCSSSPFSLIVVYFSHLCIVDI